MTIWSPDLDTLPGPRYRALADAIEAAIASGALPEGTRLPPQRELAFHLSLTVGTVSRGYALAEERGLLTAEVGRGTFVRRRAAPPPRTPHGRSGKVHALAGLDHGLIDLTINTPDRGFGPALAPVLDDLARQRGDRLADLLSYTQRAGLREHREAAAAWIARSQVAADPDRTIITGGAHQGLLAALRTLTRPGDAVLTEALAYGGLQSIATSLNLHLEPVALDEQGLIPEALDEACETSGARVLATNPTLHNPTTVTTPPRRREALAEIVRRHDLMLVEDDVYGLLQRTAVLPYERLVPERTVFVTSVSKTLAPGLRVGFIHCPQDRFDAILATKHALFLSQPAMNAEVFARAAASGVADQVLASHRLEGERRQALARALLPEARIPDDPAFHAWLPLPSPWRGSDFVAAAEDLGIALAPGEAFATGRGHAPPAVRLSLSAPRSLDELEGALRTLRDLLSTSPQSRAGYI